MTTPPKARGRRRARTETQKEARRRAIVDAATAQLRVSGVAGFSMAALAKEVRLAKGTLYLYFPTREELLITVFAEQQAAWCEALVAGARPGMSDEAFLGLFVAASRADPLFMELAGQLGSVIEQNVSVERLVASKRALKAAMSRVAEHLGPCLDLEVDAARRALIALACLLLGASQLNAGPRLEGSALPDDLCDFVTETGPEEIFFTPAALILAGLRK